MTPTQRQSAFDTYLAEIAQALARRLRMDYVCTVRRLPPPPFPGEKAGAVLYFVNGAQRPGAERKLVEFTRPMYAALRQAEAWVDTGKGRPPASPK